MRNALIGTALALPLMVLAGTAQAQTRTDPVAQNAIVQGDFSAAEQRLTAEQRIFPNKPEVLLNLAAVYARTGRADAARALYTQVLAQENVLMDLAADRVAASHQIAQTGLRRISGTQMSAR
jgi:Flp pilus assembly protein TadD